MKKKIENKKMHVKLRGVSHNDKRVGLSCLEKAITISNVHTSNNTEPKVCEAKTDRPAGEIEKPTITIRHFSLPLLAIHRSNRLKIKKDIDDLNSIIKLTLTEYS